MFFQSSNCVDWRDVFNVCGFDDSGMFGFPCANGFMVKSRTFGPSCFILNLQEMALWYFFGSCKGYRRDPKRVSCGQNVKLH